MMLLPKNTLSLWQIVTINYVSAHCAYYARPPRWYEEQFALKGHTQLSDYLRSELPTNEKTRLKHNDIETLTNDLVAYAGRCEARGESFRVLTDPDVIEPDHTNELSYFVWAKSLGFDVDIESWSPEKARTLSPIYLGCLAAKTHTLISQSNIIPWTTWLAQLVTDLNKSIRSPGTPDSSLPAGSPLLTPLSLNTTVGAAHGLLLFRSDDDPGSNASPGKIQYPSPRSQETDYGKLRVRRQFNMVRVGNTFVEVPLRSHGGDGQPDGLVMDCDGYEGKLAFLVCIYKRLYPKTELSVMVRMSQEQSLPGILLFFCHAILENLGRPRYQSRDPEMLNNYIKEITQLSTSTHEPLQPLNHLSASRRTVLEAFTRLYHLFPGDFTWINFRSITSKQLAIVVGFYLGRTNWIPRSEAGVRHLIKTAMDIANEMYRPKISTLLNEFHLGTTGTFYNSDSGDSETDEEDMARNQMEEEATNLSILSKDIFNESAMDYCSKFRAGAPFVNVSTLQHIAGHPQMYLKVLVLYVALHEGSSQTPYTFASLYDAFMQKGLFQFPHLCRKRLVQAFRPYGTCRHDLLADFEDLRLRVKTRNGRGFTRLHLKYQLEPGLDDKAVLLLLGRAAGIYIPDCSHDTLVKIALLTGILLARSGFYTIDSSSVTDDGHGVALHFLSRQRS
ncbi:hypothetical protein FSARC_13846 [Fusarium sarcochroum]|uniref:Uncharacterized protein n=1 Tax=Fusarium sarcochroum TaxID=1208366 RepID=A0A8H4SYT1_9HYPO|nr:hypothetical protein FSARC_13846 [Fusarium sarcochroum]